MGNLTKSATVCKGKATDEALARINLLTLGELTAEQVFVFRMVACDNQVDRDTERFSDQALTDMSVKFVGKPVIFDHNWSATKQTARVFDAEVVDDGAVKRLILSCYMLTDPANASLVSAIEGGILKECSIGVAIQGHICSVCGENFCGCPHIKGREYDGEQCHVILDGLADAYEVSFVAIPAQPGAGVIKSFSTDESMEEKQRFLEIEEQRYGGYYG